jgi:hypothetical protein
MGLTRTRFIQANTALAKIQDPITVLNSESTIANIDVGFLINRDSGLSANSVIYWSEAGSEFVTALTANTGIPDANIVVSSYANLKLGSVFGNIGGGNDQANVYITGSLIPSSNVEYDLGTSTNRFRSIWVSGNTIYIGRESISVDGSGTWSFSSGNMIINIGENVPFNSPSMTTGNLTVTSIFDASTIIASNVTVTSNLTIQGTQFIANTTDVAFVDSKIELHTLPNLAPLTSDDGRDIGFKFHYYKTEDEHAFLGWRNSTGYLEWFDSGREGVGNVFTGNTYGTIKSGGLILANTTTSTSATTGALQVAGGVGIAGNLYVNNVGDVSANVGAIIAFVDVLDANIGSFQIYANANLSTQTENISNITSTANTNTAAYISTYTGNIGAGNVSVVSNVFADRLFTNTGLYWYGNGATFSSSPGGASGQIQYNNAGSFDGSQLLFYAGSGNLVATATTVSTSINTGGLVLKGGLGVNGNIFAGGLNGTLYGSLFIGTTDINYNRSSGEQTLTGVGIDGTAGTATNAVNTQVSSNISSGTAYVTFVSVTSGNTAQNVNTSLTYNPNTGNLQAYGVFTDTGIYWAGNGAIYGSTDEILRANVGAYQTFANANVSSLQTQIFASDANIGAYQIFANANVSSLQTQIFASDANIGAYQIFANSNSAAQATSINTINANLGAYQIFANANVSSLQTQIFASDANIGAFYNYANTKIGTNTNSNLVVVSTTQSTSATTGALVVAGGLGVGANVTFAGNTTSAGKLIITEDTDALPYVMGSGAFHVAGGISIGKDLWVGGNIWVNNVISQTSTILQVSEPLVYLFPNSASYNYDIGAFSEIPVGGIPKYTGIVRSVQSGEWVFFSNIANQPTSGSVGITEANVIYDPVKVGNLVVSNTTISSSTTTGALIVRGGAGITGNVYADALRTTTGIYWAGNGNPIAGITYTASASSPAGSSNGDQWYDTVNDILYEYIFDGTSSYWVDIQTSVIAANASTAITDGINANIGAFYTYANTKIGTNANNNIIASNIISTGSGVFRGPYDENSILSGVFVGNTGTAPGITPRVGFFNGNTQQNWQIDNNGGVFRWFVPGSVKLSLYPNGNVDLTGSVTVNGKRAVNGPAFSAYANATPQTITTGSQQKVLFQTEEFDTDNCYASSTFTPTVEGYYQLNAEVRLDGASGTGEMMIVIWKNGAEHKRGTNQQGTQIAANFWAMTVSSLVYANGTTDFFEIYVQHGAGVSRTVTAVDSPNITWFNGCMVRGA